MQVQEVLLEHLWISLVPWLLGGLSGGGLGYGLALALRGPVGARPRFRRFAMLLPWRSLAFTLAAISVFSPYTLISYGPGQAAGLVSVSLLVFVLALPLTTGATLRYWSPPDLGERLVALARSLGVATVVIAILVTLMGAGGAGSLIWMGMREYDYARMWAGYSLAAALSLALDVSLGGVEILASRVQAQTSLMSNQQGTHDSKTSAA